MTKKEPHEEEAQINYQHINRAFNAIKSAITKKFNHPITKFRFFFSVIFDRRQLNFTSAIIADKKTSTKIP